MLNSFPFCLQVLCKCSTAGIPTAHSLSFLCGQPLWCYSLAALLTLTFEGFDWTTVSNHQIQKPRTRQAEISPISLKNNGEVEWRCSDLCLWSQRAAGGKAQLGRAEGLLWADRKRHHLLCPLFGIFVKMMDTPALLRIFPHHLVFGCVHFCHPVELKKCRARSSSVRMNIMNALQIFYCHCLEWILTEFLYCIVSMWGYECTISMINKVSSLFHSNMLLCLLLHKTNQISLKWRSLLN